MVNRQRTTRRGFMRQAAAAGAILGFPAIIPSAALGADGAVAPSNRVALGFIGLGEHGRKVNLNGFSLYPDAQVAALCDVDNERLRDAHLALQLLYATEQSVNVFQGCMATGDWREIVARDDVDALVISTPDHWHVIPALAGVRAGMDVFCEKPLSLTVHEGRVLSDTVRRYARCFITGSENRSRRAFVRACELVRNGRIGKLHTMQVELFRGFGVGSQDPEGANEECAPEPVPPGFDYDLWLGQAPQAPYTPRRCHLTYRYILDYSGGNLTDFGAHLLDIAQWANGTELTGPVRVEGRGVFPNRGLFNTATDWELLFEYDNGVRLICRSGSFFVRFEGSEGWVQADSSTITASSPRIYNALIGADEIHLRTCPQGEHRDFLNAVKSRSATYAPAEVGHRSVTLAHIGNIAMMLGRRLAWDPGEERFTNDDDANAMLSRPMRSPWRLDA